MNNAISLKKQAGQRQSKHTYDSEFAIYLFISQHTCSAARCDVISMKAIVHSLQYYVYRESLFQVVCKLMICEDPDFVPPSQCSHFHLFYYHHMSKKHHLENKN